MDPIFVALITAIITSIIGPTAVHYVKLWTERKEKKDLMKDALKTSVLIENKIDQIREEYKADRVWVSQFHNGGNYYPTGKSIQKFSMFYESVSIDTLSIKFNFQNIPVSLFSRSIHHLSENNKISIPDVSTQEDYHGLKFIAEENKCKSTYQFAIKTIEGKFIGIVGLEYTKKKKDLSEDETNKLMLQATTIGGVLGNLLFNK